MKHIKNIKSCALFVDLKIFKCLILKFALRKDNPFNEESEFKNRVATSRFSGNDVIKKVSDKIERQTNDQFKPDDNDLFAKLIDDIEKLARPKLEPAPVLISNIIPQLNGGNIAQRTRSHSTSTQSTAIDNPFDKVENFDKNSQFSKLKISTTAGFPLKKGPYDTVINPVGFSFGQSVLTEREKNSDKALKPRNVLEGGLENQHIVDAIQFGRRIN